MNFARNVPFLFNFLLKAYFIYDARFFIDIECLQLKIEKSLYCAV